MITRERIEEALALASNTHAMAMGLDLVGERRDEVIEMFRLAILGLDRDERAERIGWAVLASGLDEEDAGRLVTCVDEGQSYGSTFEDAEYDRLRIKVQALASALRAEVKS